MLRGRISYSRLLNYWMWYTKRSLYLHHRGLFSIKTGYFDLNSEFRTIGIGLKTDTHRGFVCVCVCVCVCVVKADSDTYDLTSPIPRTRSNPVLLHIPVKAVPWTVKRNLHNLPKHDSLPLHINCKLPPAVQDHIQFLVALEKLRTATISFVISVRLPVRPSEWNKSDTTG